MERNQRIVLARRPVGRPRLADMRLETAEVPGLREGELLLEADWLSIDPYMRWRMNDEPSYAPPVPLGDPMPGRTISRVIRTRHADYAEGERVMANCGWQTHAVSDGRELRRLDAAMPHPTLALGVLGSSGFAAWVGLLRIGQAQAGQTVAVSAATGPVGATVVQLARLHGLRVIAIAGGEAKAAYARETLGADHALDRAAPDFDARLAEAAPQGIDLYFDNVGGDVLMAVLPHLRVGARVPVCGLAAWYNLDGAAGGPDRAPLLMRAILTRRLQVQGFLLADWAAELPTFQDRMQDWLRDGRVTWREHVVDGIAQAPQALIDMLDGRHLGKTVVRLRASA